MVQINQYVESCYLQRSFHTPHPAHSLGKGSQSNISSVCCSSIDHGQQGFFYSLMSASISSHSMYALSLSRHCQEIIYTVLPRNQGPVLKSENTLFWLLVVLQFCSYLRTCASYGMHFVRTCQSQHKVSVCSRKSCTTIILFHFYQSAVSFFGSFLLTCAKM